MKQRRSATAGDGKMSSYTYDEYKNIVKSFTEALPGLLIGGFMVDSP